MANETDKHENTVVFLIAPGDMLEDRWLIETRIGQGAMGSVFKGRDTKQNKTVAIKILAPEHCRKPKVLARFEREAKLMTTLRHPNIIQISGVGRRGALPYIVMQYLEGMTLYEVLKHKGGKLTPGETMAVVKQISAGLSFAGLKALAAYAMMIFLAATAYGALFLLVGTTFRSPSLVAAAFWGWEWMTLFLPTSFKRISIIHWVTSFMPVSVTTDSLFATLGDPENPVLAFVVLSLFSIACVAAATWRARRIQLSYGASE